MTESTQPPAPDQDAHESADTSALDRASASIDSAKEALGTVAASDDVTTGDAEQAGSASQDPGKAGANADAIISEASEEARVAGKAAPDAPDVRP